MKKFIQGKRLFEKKYSGQNQRTISCFFCHVLQISHRQYYFKQMICNILSIALLDMPDHIKVTVTFRQPNGRIKTDTKSLSAVSREMGQYKGII